MRHHPPSSEAGRVLTTPEVSAPVEDAFAHPEALHDFTNGGRMVTLLSEETSRMRHEFRTTSQASSGEPTVHSADTNERLGYKDFNAFGAWYNEKLRRKRGREASRHTLRTKQVHLARCANELGLSGEEFLGYALSDRSQVLFLLDRLSTYMTPGAMRSTVYALRSFGEYAVAQRWIDEAALQDHDVPGRNPEKAIVCYSQEEMELFVSAARGYDLRWWALMVFLVDTGRRVGEALALEWSWFRLEHQPPYIELPTTKNGEPQYVPLTKRLRNEVFTPANMTKLMEQNREGRQAFRRSPLVHPFPWGYGTIHTRFKVFCDRVGLPNRGFHNFRHTVITERLSRGMPLQAVSALAGHSSIAITDRRYNHTNALTYASLLD